MEEIKEHKGDEAPTLHSNNGKMLIPVGCNKLCKCNIQNHH